jgi:hypothetical protein
MKLVSTELCHVTLRVVLLWAHTGHVNVPIPHPRNPTERAVLILNEDRPKALVCDI